MFDEQAATVSVRISQNIVENIDHYYRELRINKSKQLRYIINYFFSLSPEERQQILIKGFEQEVNN